jgi:hypothetical protein
MAENDPSMFTVRSARRIGDAVKRVERVPRFFDNGGKVPKGVRGGVSQDVQILKIVDIVQPDLGGSLAGGIYQAVLKARKGTGITVTGSTFDETIMGEDGATVYFVNLVEEGQSSHDLFSSGNTATLVVGLNIGTSEDGYPVYAGPMMYPGCEEA